MVNGSGQVTPGSGLLVLRSGHILGRLSCTFWADEADSGQMETDLGCLKSGQMDLGRKSALISGQMSGLMGI